MDRPPLARQESSSTSSIEQARVRNHDDVLCPHQQRKKERKNINLRELLMPNFKPLLKKKKKKKSTIHNTSCTPRSAGRQPNHKDKTTARHHHKPKLRDTGIGGQIFNRLCRGGREWRCH
jgi:hypothetical protein